MIYIIAGGRDFDNWNYLARVCEKIVLFNKLLPSVIGGGAPGADDLGKQWAERHDLFYAEYPADWSQYGKAAGPIRNEEMAQAADGLIAFWDGESRGTKNMIDTALKHGLEVHIYRY